MICINRLTSKGVHDHYYNAQRIKRSTCLLLLWCSSY